MDQKLKARLPAFLRYKTADDLIRLGKQNDGGYLISRKDVETTETLISLGIEYDWSFEEKFVDLKKNVRVVAYDASVKRRHFIKRALRFLFRLEFNRALQEAKKYWKFKNFFQNERRHIRKFVSDITKRNLLSIRSVLSSIPSKRLYLKIDIEGSEWRILDALIASADRIVGMVIEFHDCDVHLNHLNDFLSKIPHRVIHIHANNWGDIGSNGVPHSLEISFSKSAQQLDYCLLPHPLDMPNYQPRPDIELVFDDAV